MSALQYAASDTLVLAKRNLARIPRAPDLLIGYTVQPIMFVLLFVYVFGGAINTPGLDYVDFLIPGIIVQTMAFGGFVTALGLAEDLNKGLIDRFRSLPMARSAVLTGRTLADVATNLLSLVTMINPFSTMVDAARALFVDGPHGNDVWGAVAWCLGLIVIFGALAVNRYRRAVTR